MRVTNITAAWLLCAAFAMPAWTQDASDIEESVPEAAEEAAPQVSFDYRTGDVVLPNKVATLHLGERYRYLNPAETNKLLMAWGNPSNPATQGAIVPAGVDPMTENGWAVILNYEEDGHVDDSDAADIDYEELLADMKAGTQEANEERRKQNFPVVDLVGWAKPPRYDAESKKLYWAKELDFQDTDVRILNYDVRMLGREGVLSMNAVAGMPQLEQINTDMEPLIKTAEFNPGYRYAEFNEDTDKVAAYGLGALVAGTAAAKLGLFAKLGVFLLAFKKFIFIGVVAIGGLIMKLLGRKKDQAT
jgi:uncharacterized membrane-anchored protein